jgi:predicted RNase H-like HicB family nuclease
VPQKTLFVDLYFSITMAEKFNVIVEEGEDGYLISEVIELPGCHTQAKTYDELIRRTKEAISLYLSVKKPETLRPKFVGLQQVEVEV